MIKAWLLATAIWFCIMAPVMIIGTWLFSHDASNKFECFIAALATTLVLSCAFGALTTSITITDKKEWNNGICPSCGQVWEFKGGSQYRGSHTYYYSCDNCHINIKQYTLK